MGRLSAAHVSGLDLVDKLFFNQILVHGVFSGEQAWLAELSKDLDQALGARGIAGLQGAVVRHAVLCMIEGELADSLQLLNNALPGRLPALPDGVTVEQYRAVEAYNKNYFQAFSLAVFAKVHQCDSQLVIDITNELLPRYANGPACFRFRLVERMFSFEFSDAPVDCFVWLAKMGVLNSAKYPGYSLTSLHTTNMLARLALLCEYDMLRNYRQRAGRSQAVPDIEALGKISQLSRKTVGLLLDQIYKATEARNLPELKDKFPFVQLDKLDDPAATLAFFSNMNAYTLRFRAFQGSLASWMGMLCAGALALQHREDNQQTAIYVSDFNDDTLTDRVREAMSLRGIEITPRVIYDRHRDFRESVLQIVQFYYRIHAMTAVAIPAEFPDLIYEGLAPQFERFGTTRRRKVKSA